VIAHRLPFLVLLPALAASLVLSGCFIEEKEESTVSPPPSSPPPSTQPTTDTGAGEVPPVSGQDQYPLTEQQAYGDVEAGYSVAGLVPDGEEVEVDKSSESVSEEEPEEEEKCEYAYDVASDENKYKCHPETVYKRQRVTRTIYILSGAGQGTFVDLSGAFAKAESLGVSRWRSM
jgi:hypothetical protein